LKHKRCCGADAGRRAALITVQDAAAFLPALRPAAHAERELVGSAIRGAICDRRPVARTHLAVLERDESLPDEIGVRLGAVLPSGAVWSLADAENVLPDLPPGFLGQRVREPKDGPLIERVEDWHVERVRLLCDALRRHLPLPSLPRATISSGTLPSFSPSSSATLLQKRRTESPAGRSAGRNAAAS
jgi:hypothetical protein